ncbi:MAG: hypothetical protein ABI999_12500 [Acidobacteriota bacterium]
MTLTDQEKTAFTALTKIMDPATSNQVREILAKQDPQQSKRVFLQFLQPGVGVPEDYLKDAERNLRGLLGRAGFTVPKSQTFSNISLSGSQVRYFYSDDSGLADKIATLLSDAGVPHVVARPVSGYENVPHGQLEIWFAPDALTDPGTVSTDDFYLRSTPELMTNNKLVYVPAGQTVQRQICPYGKTKVGGQTGRWCRMYYNGQLGWALDVWLAYTD